MHLKTLKYALKYAVKTIKICTKKVKCAKYALKIISNFAEF